MEAPFLLSIREKIAGAKNQSAAACLTAELAIYLTRIGKIEEAIDIANRIRVSTGLYSDPERYLWLCILEGLNNFYSSACTSGSESLRRAYSIAVAINRVDLQQYAAAWLAHHCFNSGVYPEMAKWIRISGLSKAINPSAAIRASLTYADAIQVCGDDLSASRWYLNAREMSIKIGDRASIMASIENRAAMKLDRIWFESIYRTPDADEISKIESELLGGLSYERITKSESFVYQGLIWRARINMLNKNYPSALEMLTRSRKDSSRADVSLAWTHDADISWVLCQLGNVVDARVAFKRACTVCVERMDRDDAAVHWHRLSVLDLKLEAGVRSIEYQNKSIDAAMTFRESLELLKGSIGLIDAEA